MTDPSLGEFFSFTIAEETQPVKSAEGLSEAYSGRPITEGSRRAMQAARGQMRQPDPTGEAGAPSPASGAGRRSM
jgi:hypothetical protein